MRRCIFIVDDEPQLGRLFESVLRRDGYDAYPFVSATEALAALDGGLVPDLVLTDLLMPDVSGLDLLRALTARGVTAPVLVMTAHSSVRSAVEAMQLGALHYLQKPINLEEMRALLARTLELHGAREELDALRRHERSRFGIGAILGDHPAIEAVRATLHTLADAPDATVLLCGETGTGKNLVARAVHHTSVRGAGRFLELNCAAFPDNLLEAELFGYEKGAFTDARQGKPGLLEVAEGGTVFLDEVDSMSPALQAKLLSFLESRTVRRLGGLHEIPVSTRVVCATNADLGRLVAEKAFRRDLYYRLNVVSVELPPLRELGRDVLVLAHAALAEIGRSLGREATGFTPEAEARLMAHPWPGNVRELRNAIERALIFSRGPRIGTDALVLTSLPGDDGAGTAANGGFSFAVGGTLEDLERAYIADALARSTGTYADVAEQLGISKKTLWEKRKRYDLDAPAGA